MRSALGGIRVPSVSRGQTRVRAFGNPLRASEGKIDEKNWRLQHPSHETAINRSDRDDFTVHLQPKYL